MVTTRKTTKRTPAAKPRTSAQPGVAKRARTRGVEPAAPAPSLDAIDRASKLKKDLEAVSAKLNGVDRASLDAEQLALWQQQMMEVRSAINATRLALLEGLNDAFAAEIPQLQASTAELAKALERLNNVAKIIDAVAGVLGVISRVIQLA